MLELYPPSAQTGLAGHDFLVGCLAENDPRVLGQALRLVQSIRWFGGELAKARVRVCIAGGLDRSFRRAFESYAAEVRIVSPFQRSERVVNEPHLFPEAWETEREMLLLLDCDTVVLQDPLPWMRRGSFQARTAPPPTRGPEAPGFDSGVVLLPSHLARQLFPVWRDHHARLADVPEDLQRHASERQRAQASLSLALADCAAPVEEAPLELNFQLDFSRLPLPEGFFAADPAIVHYRGLVDPEGYLSHTSHPFAQVRIEAFNRRLRQEREGRAEWARPGREKLVPQAAPAAQVVVLGMHRSGTSALTGLLRLLGLWAGGEGDFPPADDHNQAGYWEHRGVWSVDEAILRTLGASWSEPTGFDLSQLGEGLRARLQGRAREVVQELDGHGPWVIKDPRLCLLVPFWREILAHPFCVLVYREPLPVARSLAARDGIPILYGIALWERYTREALASTQGMPRVLISHRELMAEPEATLRRLHHQLVRLGGPQLARLRFPTAEEIRAVVDPALVHHRRDPEAERAYLNPPQIELLEALESGTALALDPVPPLSAGARDLLASYQELQATERGLRDQLDVQAQAAARVPATADLRRALSWFDELDAIVSEILDSRSWKIGRAVTTAMGRLLGRSRTSATERRDRLKAEVRRWRENDPEE